MAYATSLDLASNGLPDAALLAFTSTQITAALANASDEADSYLRARYQLPLVTWGADITSKVCQIAAWHLLCTKGFNPESGSDIAVRTRYTDAVSWFRDVSKRITHANVTPLSDTVTGLPQTNGNLLRGW